MTAEFDNEGLHATQRSTILTWTGRRVDPQSMAVGDIVVEDIAHATARQCRYNGHTYGHLSVARHCLWVADHLAEVAPKHELWGLLHDAGEAYLGDMVRPVKHTPAMQPFRDAEGRLDEVLAHRFALPWPMPQEVRDADSWVLLQVEMSHDDYIGARFTWKGNADADKLDWLNRYRQLTGDFS